MMDKDCILKRLRSAEHIPLDELNNYLISEDKDIKHEAWNYVLRNLKSLDKKYLLYLLQFPDTGTRYRAWNEVPVFIKDGILTFNEVKELTEYFFEILKDDNITVRTLGWYITLIPLIEIGLVKKKELARYYKWLCDLEMEELEEIKAELGVKC
ncbi:hypothetical protein EWF20_12590 [Sulfolobus sp. S-194]|nr:hypothetical protein EWF20_12590 [Sulfolobus sp. S-194]